MKPLSERMENRTGTPKSWIAEVKKLQQTIKKRNEKIAEYGDIIDVLARKVEELNDEQEEGTAQDS